jgi:hypothetical protein
VKKIIYFFIDLYFFIVKLIRKQKTKEQKVKTINEKYEITLEDKKVEVIHQGFKSLKEHEDGLNEVKKCIQGSIHDYGKTDGFIPYNNFECAITWRVI